MCTEVPQRRHEVTNMPLTADSLLEALQDKAAGEWRLLWPTASTLCTKYAPINPEKCLISSLSVETQWHPVAALIQALPPSLLLCFILSLLDDKYLLQLRTRMWQREPSCYWDHSWPYYQIQLFTYCTVFYFCNSFSALFDTSCLNITWYRCWCSSVSQWVLCIIKDQQNDCY